MANRWGNSVTVTDFIFWGSKITTYGDCSLGRKAVTNLSSILKNRDITLPTKVRLVKAMVFPVVMYGCESWINDFTALRGPCEEKGIQNLKEDLYSKPTFQAVVLLT